MMASPPVEGDRGFWKKLWHWFWGIPWDLSIEEREKAVMKELDALFEIHRARREGR